MGRDGQPFRLQLDDALLLDVQRRVDVPVVLCVASQVQRLDDHRLVIVNDLSREAPKLGVYTAYATGPHTANPAALSRCPLVSPPEWARVYADFC